MAPLADTSLESLLEFIRDARGFDFTGYKRPSVQRRVSKRMSELGIERYEDYLDHLQLHGEEFVELFNTLLINVTGFFRDPATWEYLATNVIPELLASRPPEAPLRVWSAGCSSGEEAYTIAMVLARAMGEDAFRERVKIYATDVDEDALDRARQGAYLPRQIEDVPRQALERFFERTDQRYIFRKDLRRSVIFGRNDLVQDAPMSRVDLLVCRNVLMYFTPETQVQILRRFHFGLSDMGVLLLGKSEMLITHSDLFTPVDVKWRVFRKVIRTALRDRVRVLSNDLAGEDGGRGATTLREAAFNVGGTAQLVLDRDGVVVLANENARRMFGLGMSELGRPIQDLEVSFRPVELRAHLEVLRRDRRPIELSGATWGSGEHRRVLQVSLAPLMSDGELVGTSITYADVTEAQRLQERLNASRRELEQAYEELQTTVEELETTNEELQSTNEELETTNEELQSTNEELETMNEELQSSNEELETMNEELRHRTLELNDINSFLETILTTIGLAVAVLDREQHVQIWNGQARELWGLTAEEVEDRHLLSLDFGLPVEQLKPALRQVLAGEVEREEVVVPATNRRGRQFRCRVTLLPFQTTGVNGKPGLIVLMEPAAEPTQGA